MFDMVIVFMENKAGKLAKITKTLADNNINILLSDIKDTGQFGIFRFLTDNPTKAKDILYDANFTVALEKNVVVEVEDKIGGLAKLGAILDESKINIQDALGCILQKGEKAAFVIKSDDPQALEAALKDKGIKIIDTL